MSTKDSKIRSASAKPKTSTKPRSKTTESSKLDSVKESKSKTSLTKTASTKSKSSTSKSLSTTSKTKTHKGDDIDDTKQKVTLPETPFDHFGLSAASLPEGSIIPTPDNFKWVVKNKKWSKTPSNGSLGNIVIDDSVIIADPITFLPGEKCTCGRPKTEFEKIGVFTYGDYLKKCCIKGQISNVYGKNIKFSDQREGMAMVIRNFDRPENRTSRTVPIKYKKSSNGTVRDAIIEF